MIAIVPPRLESPQTDRSRPCHSIERPGHTRSLVRIIQRLAFQQRKTCFPANYSRLPGKWTVLRRRGEQVVGARLCGNNMMIRIDMHIDLSVCRERTCDVIKDSLTRKIRKTSAAWIAVRGAVRVCTAHVVKLEEGILLA